MAKTQLHYVSLVDPGDTAPELPFIPSRNDEESPNVILSPIAPPFEMKQMQNKYIKTEQDFGRLWWRNLWRSAKASRIT